MSKKKLTYTETRALACMGALALGREDLAVLLLHDKIKLEQKKT